MLDLNSKEIARLTTVFHKAKTCPSLVKPAFEVFDRQRRTFRLEVAAEDERSSKALVAGMLVANDAPDSDVDRAVQRCAELMSQRANARLPVRAEG